jgi:aromatic-L-amino-acid decarboxylase
MAPLLEEVGRRTIEHLASLPEQPAQATENAAEVQALVREPLPEEGCSLDSILSLLFDKIIPCSLNTAGPGYLAYVPGGGLCSGAIAEFVAAAVNRYAGVWAAAPGAAEVETQALRWLARLLGFPAGTLGVLTTGGSLSNLVAIVAAREKILGDELPRGTVYCSREAHYSVVKAARVAGVRRENLRSIPVDSRYRMRIEDLESQIRADRNRGLRPFLICGSAGTVNTGSVDPLADIARVAAREGMWFHIDGAYGGVFRMLPELEATLDGMEKADSLAVDPHKGLFLAYGTGALIVRDIGDLQRAYTETGAYLPAMQESSDRLDFFSLSPELSRDWRGLRLWLPFKLHGAAAFREALREKRELALKAWKTLAAEPDVEIAAPPELSLFAFRQRFPGRTLVEENRLNQDLLARINAPRRIMLTGTTLDGKFYIRVCILHLRTHRDRVEEGLQIILNALAAGRGS